MAGTDLVVATEDRLDSGLLLGVLTSVKKGDFSVRMPADMTGVAGKIYDTVNDIVNLNELMAGEIARVSTLFDQDGQTSPRASRNGRPGGCASCIDSVALYRKAMEIERQEAELEASARTLEAQKEEIQALNRDLKAASRELEALKDAFKEQAIRDPLTGLFNRRYLEESLDRELHRAKREEARLGVIMVDVDHFKRFNDTYGHEAGNQALASLGSLLAGLIRAEDIACRFGGEEFVLVLPGAPREAILRRAEAIRQAVHGAHSMQGAAGPGTITVSLGVALFPENGATRGALLAAADRALYRAKNDGRNRVAAPEPESATSVKTLIQTWGKNLITASGTL